MSTQDLENPHLTAITTRGLTRAHANATYRASSTQMPHNHALMCWRTHCCPHFALSRPYVGAHVDSVILTTRTIDQTMF
jgi:hypothetical protein